MKLDVLTAISPMVVTGGKPKHWQDISRNMH